MPKLQHWETEYVACCCCDGCDGSSVGRRMRSIGLCGAADNVGKPVSRLQEAFGPPRKIDTTPTKLVYVWFMEETPPGAPVGFHGCEMEVTVDARTQHVLGYSLSNIGWARCPDVQRKIHVAER